MATDDADAGSSGPERSTQGTDRCRICVLGGGFGGLYTALRLQQLPWRGRRPLVTLVDKRDKFTFLPLLYEFAVGSAELDEVAPTFRDLLADTGISFVQARASDVELSKKEVSLVGAVADDLDGFVVSDNADATRTLGYDKLVIAVGAEPASGMDRVPGASRHAVPFYSIEDSYRVKKAIQQLKAQIRRGSVARVVVVGGSYGGVEIACNLAVELRRGGQRLAEVTLATSSEVLSAATPGNREAGLRRLQQSGVRVLTETAVAEVKEGGIVVLRDVKGEGDMSVTEIESDLLVWTAGSRPSPLVSRLEVAKDGRGRVEVNRRLQPWRRGVQTGDSDDASAPAEGGVPADGVYCMGDIASVRGMDLTSSAQVAIQQSDYVAYNIWAEETGRAPLDFRYANLGELMNLGGLEGSLSALGGRIQLGGKAAGLARRAIYAVRMPTNPQRARAAASAAIGTAFSVTNALLEKTVEIVDRAR